MEEIQELLKLGESQLLPEQKSVLGECTPKSRFGLSLHMGYGKSILTIVIALNKKFLTGNTEPFVIICPKTIISSWEVEIRKFFGIKLHYQIMNNDSRNFKLRPDTMVVLTTPETVAKFYKDNDISEKFIKKEQYFDGIVPFPRVKNIYNVPEVPYLRTFYGGNILFHKKWSCVAVDEAHKYTNIETARCQGIAALCSSSRWLLSGTLFDEPAFDRILGYYIMLHWPSFPRSLPDAVAYLSSRNYKGTNETIVTRPTTVIKDLTVNKHVIEHDLNIYEAKIYMSMKETLKQLKAHLRRIHTLNKSEKRKFSSYILAMITFLRQSVVIPILPIANITLDMAEIKDARSELSVILTKQFNKLEIDDFLNDENSAKSSRIQKVLETISKHNKPTDKIVVFSCFRTSLDILEYYVNEEIPIDLYTIKSGMTISARGKLIKEFQETNENSILFTTYEMGSEGLNLQAGNVVIILDFWWNNSKTQQAISRVVRTGQKASEVNIYFYTSNTGIEKALFEKQQDKIILLNEIKTGPMKSSVKTMKIDEILKLIDKNENVKFLNEYYKR